MPKTDTYLCLICNYITRAEIISFEAEAENNHAAKLNARKFYLAELDYGSFKQMKDVAFDIEVVRL